MNLALQVRSSSDLSILQKDKKGVNSHINLTSPLHVCRSQSVRPVFVSDCVLWDFNNCWLFVGQQFALTPEQQPVLVTQIPLMTQL